MKLVLPWSGRLVRVLVYSLLITVLLVVGITEVGFVYQGY